MKRALYVFLAALVVFVWQAISWTALPFHTNSLGTIKDETAVAAALSANLPGDGMYTLPSDKNDPNTVADRYAKGPVATISYRAVGGEMMAPAVFFRGFLLDVLVAALLSVLLGMTDLRSYLPRVIFVSLVGLAMGLFTNLNNWNWMAQSTHYTVVDVVDTWVAWSLAGMVLGKLPWIPRA